MKKQVDTALGAFNFKVRSLLIRALGWGEWQRSKLFNSVEAVIFDCGVSVWHNHQHEPQGAFSFYLKHVLKRLLIKPRPYLWKARR